MNINQILDNISSFIIDPNRNTRTSLEKGFAWTTTIIVAVGTLGIAHCLSALWRQLRHIEKNDTQEQISHVFQSLFSGTKATDKPSALSSEPKDFSAAVTLVLSQVDTFWKAAAEEVNGPILIPPVFCEKIKKAFAEKGFSLANIYDNPDAAEAFFQNKLIKENLRDEHLVFITVKISANIESYQAELLKAGMSEKDTKVALKNFIINSYAKEGRSLDETTECPEALAKLRENVLVFDVLTQCEETKEDDTVKQPISPEVKEAQELGEKHGLQENDIIKQIGLDGSRYDAEKLKKGILIFLARGGHPDKGGDPEVAAQVGSILAIINNGHYSHYHEGFLRGQSERTRR